MFISHKYKFILLRNRKCASTSLVNSLRPYCDVTDKNCLDILGVSYSVLRHMKARDIKNVFVDKGWPFSDYKVILTIRNPWDRAVSAYHYEKDVVKSVKLKDMSFKEYLLSKIFYNFALNNNYNSIAINNGVNLVTHTLQTEHINSIWPQFCADHLQISGVELPKSNSTVRDDYRSYYSESFLVDLVGDNFKSDIDVGKYEF